MIARLFNLGTCTCAVAATSEVLTAMDHYLSAYTSAGGPVDFRVTLNCDRDSVSSVRRSLHTIEPVAARRSHPGQQYHVWNDQGREILLSLTEQHHVVWKQGTYINVTAETSKVAATVGTRILRQLIMRGGEAQGGHAVHAGAVVLNDTGVLVGGPSGSGKTTVLTRLIEHHGARPIANDRTVVTPTARGEWIAVGVPLAWRFTPEGLQTLQRPESTAAPISRVVVLSRSPGHPPRPDAATLRRQLAFGDDDFFWEDWLNVSGELPGTTAPRNDIWTGLHTSIPVQALSWAEPAELPGLAATIARGAEG
jgi:hypothetical protein